MVEHLQATGPESPKSARLGDQVHFGKHPRAGSHAAGLDPGAGHVVWSCHTTAILLQIVQSCGLLRGRPRGRAQSHLHRLVNFGNRAAEGHSMTSTFTADVKGTSEALPSASAASAACGEPICWLRCSAVLY